MGSNPNKPLRAPQCESSDPRAQAGDLKRERDELQGDQIAGRGSFPKRRRKEGAGSTESAAPQAQRTPITKGESPSPSCGLQQLPVTQRKPATRDSAAAPGLDCRKQAPVQTAAGMASSAGPPTEGVWKPRPEESFPPGVAPVTGVSREEAQEGLRRAQEGISLARQGDVSGNLTALTSQVQRNLKLLLPELRGRQVAPHVLSRFVLSSFDQEVNDALVSYYRKHPSEYSTTLLQLRAPEQPPTPGEFDMQTVTDFILQSKITGIENGAGRRPVEEN